MPKLHLEGRRILVVEDNFLIALDLVQTLASARADVIGPLPTANASISEVKRRSVDGALIDLGLRDERADKLLEYLSSRAIPFVISSAYDADTMPRYRAVFVEKPAPSGEVIRRLADTMMEAGRGLNGQLAGSQARLLRPALRREHSMTGPKNDLKQLQGPSLLGARQSAY